MKSSIMKISIFTAIALAAVVSASADNDKGSREIGRVLFKNESASEIMVLSSIETPSLYITRGSVLDIGKGDGAVKISVADICGLYIRCAIIKQDNKPLSPVREGDIVFYSDSSNALVKYGDVKMVLSALIKLYEDFIFKVESVEEPAVISEYIERFSSDIEKLIPEMERLNSKYPELLKFYSEPPSELKYESETLKLLEPALRNTFFKINIYAEDPAVKRSIEKLHKVLEKMRGSGR